MPANRRATNRPAGAEATPLSGRSVALVVWSGRLGGSETFTVELAGALRQEGVDARLVFVGKQDRLGRRIDELGLSATELGLARGRHAIAHPRRLARLVAAAGEECAILPSSGYLAAALRAGGYRQPVAAVEHGGLLQVPQLELPKRILRRVDRASGIWACDVEIAVSDYVLAELKSRRHAERLIRIRNGIDLARFRPPPNPTGDSRRRPFTVGYAGRLVAGKGVADLIRAFALPDLPPDALLRVAGEGDQRAALEDLARAFKVESRVTFVGLVDDMPEFWRGCDVGAVPSSQAIESFCLAAVEAMASGCPVVATAVGALPEIVRDAATGWLVEPGNVAGLGRALGLYAQDQHLRTQHGTSARKLCEVEYDLSVAAQAYAELIRSLVNRRATH
jgi:glycosyltransferase involved in cell wall biosynthesis